MGLNVSRTTEPLRFDVGIGKAGYADIIASPGAGEPQKTLMPGTTTVSQALDDLFPPDRSVNGEIMRALVAGNPASLRTPRGFSESARIAARSLRERGSEASDRAAHEIENLLADADLLEHCRMALLET
ncbi:MAG: hypothetical protein J6W80_05005 [Kiritimatiellae bacterium]|nr:hypothetical protein [Kiritimatiellia bacterium]